MIEEKTKTILLVCEDVEFYSIYREIIEYKGFRVFACSSIARAKNIFHIEQVDILITDLELDDGNGISLSETLLKSKPALSTILMSGHDKKTLDHQSISVSKHIYLEKPFHPEELLDAIITLEH